MPIELVNKSKVSADQGGLRLVNEARPSGVAAKIERQFVSFIFLRIHPEWRRLDGEAKERYKDNFEKEFLKFSDDLMLFSYSLVGLDSKADLMFWRIGNSMDKLQEMTIKLFRTELGSYLETAETYLAVTKKTVFINGGKEDRDHVNAGEKKYHFVYPLVGFTEKNGISSDECNAVVETNFMVGKRFPNIRIHLTHMLGFSDHEYIISFETDDPGDFLELSEEIKESFPGDIVLSGLPTYTCRQRPLRRCLDALG